MLVNSVEDFSLFQDNFILEAIAATAWKDEIVFAYFFFLSVSRGEYGVQSAKIRFRSSSHAVRHFPS